MRSAVMLKVFSTIKLLEQILLHLPNKSLSRSKQVCWLWKVTVEGSLPAQKKLFQRSSDYREFKTDDFFYAFLAPRAPKLPNDKAHIINPMFQKYVDNLEALAGARRGAWQNTLIAQPAMTALVVAIDTGKSTIYRVSKHSHGLWIRDVANWLRVFLINMDSHSLRSLELHYAKGYMG